MCRYRRWLLASRPGNQSPLAGLVARTMVATYLTEFRQSGASPQAQSAMRGALGRLTAWLASHGELDFDPLSDLPAIKFPRRRLPRALPYSSIAATARRPRHVRPHRRPRPRHPRAFLRCRTAPGRTLHPDSAGYRLPQVHRAYRQGKRRTTAQCPSRSPSLRVDPALPPRHPPPPRGLMALDSAEPSGGLGGLFSEK